MALFSAELAWADFPKATGSVTDAAHVLDEPSTRALAALLLRLLRRSRGFAVGARVRSKTVVPITWGALFGGIPPMMATIPFFNASVWILGPFGLAMAALGYRKSGSWTQTLRIAGKAGTGASSTGWMMGGGNTGGGSGGGFDSGDFGGGASGGGRASGSW